MATLICVPITVAAAAAGSDIFVAIDAALADGIAARNAGAELVEWRIDQIFTGGRDNDERRAVARLVDEAPLPCIVTCRSSAEGGDYQGDDESRLALYQWLADGADGAIAAPPRYIDIEWSTLQRSTNRLNLQRLLNAARQADPATSLILSLHDFTGRPRDLLSQLVALRNENAARLLKIAFRARSLRDNLELFELLQDADRPMIALAMGEFGLMSRVLAPKFGGLVTFASLRTQNATAPGQPTIHELLNRFRFRSIGRRTKVYGVVGWPVQHSRSPAVHNAAFDALGHDGVYLPLPIPPEWEHFKATISALLDDPRLDLAGLSVTMPHKQHLVRLAHEDKSRQWLLENNVEQIGAANTLAVQSDGAIRVSNTDVVGIMEPLGRLLGELAGVRIAIIGAGGMARAAAFALAGAGAQVLITSRTPQRAEALAAGVPNDLARAIPPADLTDCGCEVLINCTPIGMKGVEANWPGEQAGPLGLPVREEVLEGLASREGVVIETIYAPLETPLVAAARGGGLRIITGDTVFLAQAAAQCGKWTGKSPPIAAMARAFAGTAGAD